MNESEKIKGSMPPNSVDNKVYKFNYESQLKNNYAHGHYVIVLETVPNNYLVENIRNKNISYYVHHDELIQVPNPTFEPDKLILPAIPTGIPHELELLRYKIGVQKLLDSIGIPSE